MLRNILMVSTSLAIMGCNSELVIEPSTVSQSTMVSHMKTSPKTTPDIGTAFVGKVVLLNLEGGFWAIITDSGQKLDGIIPADLRINNQKVSGAFIERPNEMSFRMWGMLVNFTELTAIESNE